MEEPVIVTRLTPGDEAALANVSAGVFDRTVVPELAAGFVKDPRHHMVVAIVGETIVGIASGVHYFHPDKPPELFINEVAVAPSHQRRGVGRRLVEELLAIARELGCVEAWVLSGSDNRAAERLYLSVNEGVVSRKDVVMFSMPLRREHPDPTDS